MKVIDLEDYKNNLYNSLSRELSDFEKHFLLIASAILGFSITFIKDIVDIHKASCLLFLFSAWMLLLLSVGIMMYTFISSAKASDEIWFSVDKFLIDGKKFDNDAILTDDEAQSIKNQTNILLSNKKSQLRNMRYSAIWCFLIGLCALSFFVGKNIIDENKTKVSDKTYLIRINRKTNVILLESTRIEYNDSTIVIQKN